MSLETRRTNIIQIEIFTNHELSFEILEEIDNLHILACVNLSLKTSV